MAFEISDWEMETDFNHWLTLHYCVVMENDKMVLSTALISSKSNCPPHTARNIVNCGHQNRRGRYSICSFVLARMCSR